MASAALRPALPCTQISRCRPQQQPVAARCRAAFVARPGRSAGASRARDVPRAGRAGGHVVEEPAMQRQDLAPARGQAVGEAAACLAVAAWAAAAPAHATGASSIAEVAASFDFSIQLLYLGSLLALLAAGSFLVVRQVLVRRELENAAKDLSERARSGEATPEEYFELGVVLLRKKFFGQAVKNLEIAVERWSADPQDLAQVHNALGFALFRMDKAEAARKQYDIAVRLQPGYVMAWNNLADVLEATKDYEDALSAYEKVLALDPVNEIATARASVLRTRLRRLGPATANVVPGQPKQEEGGW